MARPGNMNTHSKMRCPILKENITIISYPPYGSAWTGFTDGRSEIICPYKKIHGIAPVCRKKSGQKYTKGYAKDKNVCLMQSFFWE